MLSVKPLVSLRRLEYQVGIGRAQLERVADQAGSYYRPFDREKKPSSNKWRHIDNPGDPLKSIQRRLSRRVFREFDLPAELTGGLRGRSVLDNARPHVAQPTIVSLDLESYFPHVDNDRVFGALREHLGCSTQVANLLTKLTTLQERLPQGSPASSFLANLVMIEPLEKMLEVVADLGLRLTCFVDDLTISGDCAEKAIGPIVGILASHGLTISRTKLEVSRQHHERTVTGVGVSRRPTVARAKMKAARDFLAVLAAREWITEWELSRAKGLVVHATQINPSQGAYLRRRFERLPEVGDDSANSVKRTATRKCSSFRRRH